jgi:two-component system response regulator (stage 0 sporulation protein A)
VSDLNNNEVRVLIVDDNETFFASLNKGLLSHEFIKEVEYARDGLEAYKKIINISPEIVILDMVMPGLDGIGVLEKVFELEKMGIPKPKFIVSLLPGQEKFIRGISKFGVDEFILKPIEPHEMMSKVLNLINSPKRFTNHVAVEGDGKDQKVEKILTGFLNEIGIPSHIKGHRYLKHSIGLVIKDAQTIDSVTKCLYPMVADEFDSTPTRVERSIRHAIEVAWKKGRIDSIEEGFGHAVGSKKGRPSNSQFIAMIADKIRLDMFHHSS